MSATPVRPVGMVYTGTQSTGEVSSDDLPSARWSGVGTASAPWDPAVALRIRRLQLLSLGLMAAGCFVIPWIGVLAADPPLLAEPSTWNDAWIGLDAFESVGLVSTGLLLRRQDPRMRVVAAATAMLLYMDAWFDLMTAAPAERLLSVVMAVVAEVPIGTLCAVLALRDVLRCRST